MTADDILTIGSRAEFLDAVRTAFTRAEENGAREIVLPELDQHVYQNIDRNSLQFGAFAESQNTGFSYTERRYARTWLRECFAAIDEVAGLIR